MKEIIDLTASVDESHQGERIDQVLAELFNDYSRSRLQAWLKAGHILIDGKPWRAKDKVEGGETVTLHVERDIETAAKPQPIDLSIVYQDDALIIINKPAGLVVHPGAGVQDSTLMNALLHLDPNIATVPRAGIVHRLDKDTTGLMVVARTLEAHTKLVDALQKRDIRREYEAVVQGILTGGGTIDEPIGRHPVHRTKMSVVKPGQGKPAVTHFKVLTRFPQHTHVRVQLETGRTHQIRVHMAHRRHSLIGDGTYGGRLKMPAGASDELKSMIRGFKRQALHACELSLEHPVSGEQMTWQAPLPDDMVQLLAALKRG
ncbi:23S rRNA pseudouridine(1911/1915/1917) synthase RluD [Piscirickettsia litoralis]|uniref:Pseudouridine synthase n=1 Tax=Piscirickettsia litoralis TaxID=1891921 RepID=A0ABX3A3W5_9GAMM|nr:23S rRNA pseudouridine(1911/1915/1917) synthase RluD [Piscirickettsia litoralis]ODN42130.1 RNA pseudouridine synthase [Piscirickettsia litoralis]